MSLPGDRDAQRMLLGEQPLSKGPLHYSLMLKLPVHSVGRHDW